jgi:pimeloyl-ACP methyl ester carboxylesterase
MAVLRQPSRLVLALVVGLVLAVLIDIARVGGPEVWLARHRIVQVSAGQGERVDLGGRSLYLDCRGAGSPTIVLEAGMGDGVAGWTPVHDGMAATTRTCAYDRAGRGSSDARGHHTVADATDDLRHLLRVAGESPPFIVVGHSLGEVYARVFAARHRTEVLGLVLVDGFSIDLQVDWIHPLLGELRPEYEQGAQQLRDLVAGVEDLDWPASEAQLRAADVSGIPIVVLRAPREEPRLDGPTNVAIAAAWEAAFGTLSPGLVRYEIAWGAGHIIQADRPDLVIAAARELVEEARSTARR